MWESGQPKSHLINKSDSGDPIYPVLIDLNFQAPPITSNMAQFDQIIPVLLPAEVVLHILKALNCHLSSMFGTGAPLPADSLSVQALQNCSLVSKTWNKLFTRTFHDIQHVDTELSGLTLLRRLGRPAEHVYQPRGIIFEQRKSRHGAQLTVQTINQIIQKCSRIERVLFQHLKGVDPFQLLRLPNLKGKSYHLVAFKFQSTANFKDLPVPADVTFSADLKQISIHSPKYSRSSLAHRHPPGFHGEKSYLLLEC